MLRRAAEDTGTLVGCGGGGASCHSGLGTEKRETYQGLDRALQRHVGDKWEQPKADRGHGPMEKWTCVHVCASPAGSEGSSSRIQLMCKKIENMDPTVPEQPVVTVICQVLTVVLSERVCGHSARNAGGCGQGRELKCYTMGLHLDPAFPRSPPQSLTDHKLVSNPGH